MIFPKISIPQKKRAVFLALIMAILSISCGKINTASEDLIGIWKAIDFRYNNTSFEITEKTIVFRTKEGDVNSFAIVRIEKEQIKDGEWDQYTIYYRNRDLQKVEFPFYFQRTDKNMIRFVNQPTLVWKKESTIKT
jgi:hypothetical protein